MIGLRPVVGLLLLIFSLVWNAAPAQVMTNVEGRSNTSLNGKWQIIIDAFDSWKNWKPIYEDRKATGKEDFYEYNFSTQEALDVPGDWNSQRESLKYYEGTIWYKKSFTYTPNADKRVFIYFAAVNYQCEVYLNGEKIGTHEGGFTPFQFEVTGKIKAGVNGLIVRVNNERKEDAIPSLNYDWWNYGGITRDVYLVETPVVFIQDYFIQLKKANSGVIAGSVSLNGKDFPQQMTLLIPELKIDIHLHPDETGTSNFELKAKPVLWSTSNPKLYDVIIKAGKDSIRESIGFRTIEVKGADILLNGKSIFLKGVNIHEEIPNRMGRAWSEADAMLLLGWASEMGCNFVRLAHYPHNEHIVRLADKMGILVWSEIPLWQGIQFTNPIILEKANKLLEEMIGRDKNRAAIIFWSLSNETNPGKDRNEVLAKMATFARSLDSTRLITSAFHQFKFDKNTVTVDDPLSNSLDVLAFNQYYGWYRPWNYKPSEIEWKVLFNKPVLISEFGGEALYGNHGPSDTASSWSEEYQEQLYKDQLSMINKIPNLRGTIPWILADFRSPSRMHNVYQQGWNRKGLLSDKGLKKKAWYVMRDYYRSK